MATRARSKIEKTFVLAGAGRKTVTIRPRPACGFIIGPEKQDYIRILNLNSKNIFTRK